ncbi:MAG: LPS export ABC transporter permease LptF [Gammaproteobacteria bacterium]|nr:LPS export ABC transporter permease LptF [Gammaproteobacteria bacterium]
MFKVIDRYVLKECAWATLGVVAVLLVILLGNMLVRVLGDIAKGELPADTLWVVLLINCVHYLVVVLPIGLYLGILLGMGRLYRDSEMAALFACGVGTAKLYRPITALTIPIALLTVMLSMFIAPLLAEKQDEIRHQAKYASGLSGLVAGRFNISNKGKQSLFFERWAEDGEQMHQVFYYAHEEQVATVQTADAAHIQPEERATYVVFENGKAISGVPGRRDYRIIDYASHGVRVKKDETPLLKLSISSTPTSELLNAAKPELIAEWHWRLAVPVACLLLGLLALPLSYSPPRKGRYNRIGIAILIYIIYLNSLGLGRAWLEKEVISGLLGLWWAHITMLLVIVMLVQKLEHKGIFAPRLKAS